MTELLFVSAVTFAAALAYGLAWRRMEQDKDAHWKAFAAYRANPDLGWPPMTKKWPPPPCPPAPTEAVDQWRYAKEAPPPPSFHKCPVCDFTLTGPPSDWGNCPCCGTEPGYDIAPSSLGCMASSVGELRADWIARGRPWFSKTVPDPAKYPMEYTGPCQPAPSATASSPAATR